MGLGWFLTGAVFSVFVSPIILGNPENSFKVIRDVFENFVKVVGAVT
jgi:DNA repair photolyase